MSISRYCPVCGEDTREEHCPNDGAITVVKQLFVKSADGYLPRDIVAGRYRIEGALGRGAYGAVYSARHTGTDQRIALKMLTLDTTGIDGDTHVQRFFREARATARLRHLNTVRVFDVGQTEEGPLFLAMEMLQGPSLTTWLRREFEGGRRISEAHTIDIAIAALKSLGEAHRSELVHRDVKPGNIVLHRGPDDETIVKVLDFGIARAVGSNLTQTGHSLGTPAYMSPEQCRGEALDGRSDLYAISVLMYLMTTAELPYASADNMALLFMHINAPIPDPRKVEGVKLSDQFAKTLQRGLAKSADDRFKDAKAMIKELETVRAVHSPAVAEFSLTIDDPLWNIDQSGVHLKAGNTVTQSGARHEGVTRDVVVVDGELPTVAVGLAAARPSAEKIGFDDATRAKAVRTGEATKAKGGLAADGADDPASKNTSLPLSSVEPTAQGMTTRREAVSVDAVTSLETITTTLAAGRTQSRAPKPPSAKVTTGGAERTAEAPPLAETQRLNVFAWVIGGVVALVIAGAVITSQSGHVVAPEATAATRAPVETSRTRSAAPDTPSPSPPPTARELAPTAAPRRVTSTVVGAPKVVIAPPVVDAGAVAVRRVEARVADRLSRAAKSLTDQVKHAKRAVKLDPANRAYSERLVELETKRQLANAAKAQVKKSKSKSKRRPRSKKRRHRGAPKKARKDDMTPEFVD